MDTGHSHHSHRHTRARNALKPALIVTATFLVAEFIGALYTNSLALLADSGHMLTDVAALALSLAATWFATRRATPQKTYGFYRVEILVTLLNGVFLVLIALYIFYEAYSRLKNPPEVQAGWMLAVACAGLLANLFSGWMLFGEHKHSLNVRGAFFHVMADAVGSAGAIIASLAILLGGYYAADPAISILVGLLILSSSWVLIRDAVDVLLEGTPSHVDIVSLQTNLKEITGVESVHDLHVWTLTSGVLAMSCHVVVSDEILNRNLVLVAIKELAHSRFQIDHITVQLEEAGTPETVLESCGCHFGAWDTHMSEANSGPVGHSHHER
jgi:cobalt-zinc-cadmium efflux system protein